MSIITVSGLTGSGPRTLGPVLAAKIGADYIDRLILANVAKDVGATVDALHQREQRVVTLGERISRTFQRILERSATSGAGGDPYFGSGVAEFLTEEYENLPQSTITKGHELEDEIYIAAIKKTMLDIASNDNVVIVGRGSHVILNGVPNLFTVGTVSNYEDRVATIEGRENLTRTEAEEVMQNRDKARSSFFQRFLDINDPDWPGLYHIVINLSKVRVEEAAQLIIQALDSQS